MRVIHFETVESLLHFHLYLTATPFRSVDNPIMSVFQLQEWWSVKMSEDEEFDHGCMVVGNIDNSEPAAEKIAVGSLQGMLRIYAPTKPQFRVEDLILEESLGQPILQLLLGRFIPSSTTLGLAVLHPKKLAVYELVPQGIHMCVKFSYYLKKFESGPFISNCYCRQSRRPCQLLFPPKSLRPRPRPRWQAFHRLQHEQRQLRWGPGPRNDHRAVDGRETADFRAECERIHPSDGGLSDSRSGCICPQSGCLRDGEPRLPGGVLSLPSTGVVAGGYWCQRSRIKVR